MRLNLKTEMPTKMTLAELYEEFEQKLHRYATRLARDSSQADDLCQDAFLRALGHLELLGQLNRHQRQAWLFRMLKNLFIDAQNARQRQEILIEKFTQQVQLSQQIRLDSHPLVEVLSQDLLNQIPDRYYELLHKRYVLGMNSREIAKEMGIPAATVRSRLRLAIKKLRAKKSRFM